MIDVAEDRLLGGRLRLLQSRKGHRAGTDAVLLAAALASPQGHLVDAGAGAGTAGLACALRAPDLVVTLVENNAEAAGLAVRNAALNQCAARARVAAIDLLSAAARRGAGLADGTADAVLTNPPFFDAREVRASPDPARANAHVLEAKLERWMAACIAMLKPSGVFVMIHRADALAQCLAAVANRLGAVKVLPVYPQAGKPASRILLRGIKGSRARPGLAPGFVLHAAGGGFTPQAEALHRGEAVLDWG